MKYTADFHKPNELWAAFTLSPFAHARIVSVDLSAARAVDGVRAVLLAEEIGHPRMGRMLYDWPVLASGIVRFPGERVAAVAAETREALMKDPEFRKALLADLRAEASQGENGNPRTTTRLPPALARASGSNLGAERGDPHGRDDSEQAVADAAWR